ncbi:30S ribosomal protein S7 [Candidatus Azambacteria bacterium]|nr:30S ribosomal protein S7 [Candidatus Azambacteria bacterium]
MRRKRKFEREIEPDVKYGSSLVQKFINYVMRRGKKSIAEQVVYRAFDEIAKETSKTPLEVFDLAVKNASPMLEVKSRRIGGATYQVPQEVRGSRRIALAFRWILAAAKGKSGKPMAQKLAEEIIAASKNEGAAIKKKLDMHRMAEANRAFAHFAW